MQSEQTERQCCQQLASSDSLNPKPLHAGAGVFGVEMFLLADGRLLLNEIAPRPHNSGHYTIEACATSQYEQHLRAILGWPLGDTSLVVGARYSHWRASNPVACPVMVTLTSLASDNKGLFRCCVQSGLSVVDAAR